MNTMKDVTLHLFPDAGNYCVRLMRNVQDEGPNTIQIHEHVENAEVSEFPRRGVMLSSVEDMKSLRDSLNVAITMLEIRA